MKKIISVGILTVFISLFAFNVALAQISGFGFEYATGGALGSMGTRDLREVIVSVVNIVLGFLGVIAIIIILIGGFRWMISGGSEEKVTAARNMIIAGVIGLVIVLAGYAIVQFVVQAIVSSTGGG